MKTILLAALMAPGALFAQTTATTTPVGYVSLGNNGVIPAGSDTYVTIPLDREVVAQGTVASVSGSEITLSGTPGLGSLATLTSPHVAKISSGSRNGLVGLVTANTTGSVTIAIPFGDNLTGVVAGDKITIFKSWTVASFMGVSVPAQTQLLGFSGTFSGQNGAPDVIYEFDGANWIDTGSFESADNSVLYGGESLIIRNSGVVAINNFTVSGVVPTAAHRAILVRAADGTDNTQSYFSPVDEIIGVSGLSQIVAAGDQLLEYSNTTVGQNKSANNIIEFDGTTWTDTNSFEDVTNTYKLLAGNAYIIRLAAGAPSNIVWSDTPTYLPSL